MYIPKQRSPWEQMLPQILGQLAVMKIQQNFQAKQAEMQREHELTKEAIEKRYEVALKTHEAERKFGEKVAERGGRRYIMTPGGLVYAKEPSKAVTSKTAPKGTQQIISPEGRRYLMPPPVPVTVGGQTIGYQRGTKFEKAPASITKGITPSTLEKEYKWIKSLPEEEQKKAKEFIAWKYSVDPFRVLLQRELEEEGIEMDTMGRQPGETAEEYLERIGE